MNSDTLDDLKLPKMRMVRQRFDTSPAFFYLPILYPGQSRLPLPQGQEKISSMSSPYWQYSSTYDRVIWSFQGSSASFAYPSASGEDLNAIGQM